MGHYLWSIVYDEVLRLGLPAGFRTIALADDLELMVTARDTDAIVRKTNIGLNRIST